MTDTDSTKDSQANLLCKACGLCCTGHLFIWTKLRSAELDSIEGLGLKVFRSVPSQRGFNQPCPLWDKQCTIYTSASYPHFCRTYKCKLLKKLLDGATALPEAFSAIEHAKKLIHEVEMLLPDSPNANFRERLVAELEDMTDYNPEVRQKAEALLRVYKTIFGVTDLIDQPEEE
jgi:uncharacterized protein